MTRPRWEPKIKYTKPNFNKAQTAHKWLFGLHASDFYKLLNKYYPNTHPVDLTDSMIIHIYDHEKDEV